MSQFSTLSRVYGALKRYRVGSTYLLMYHIAHSRVLKPGSETQFLSPKCVHCILLFGFCCVCFILEFTSRWRRVIPTSYFSSLPIQGQKSSLFMPWQCFLPCFKYPQRLPALFCYGTEISLDLQSQVSFTESIACVSLLPILRWAFLYVFFFFTPAN